MPLTNWSTVAADNDDSDLSSGINLTEGQAAGSLNDSMRSLMAVLKGDFANSLGASGYQKLPGGLILQWGQNVSATTANGAGDGSFTVTFPIPFPTAAYIVVGIGTNLSSIIQGLRLHLAGLGATGATLTFNAGSPSGAYALTYFAIGK